MRREPLPAPPSAAHAHRPESAQEDPAPRIDLHVHGRWSRDAIGDLDALARAAQEKGLQGIALTEHDTTAHHAPIKTWNQEHKESTFRFYPGIEVSTRQGHLLAIGVQAVIRKGLDLVETIEHVKDAGGVPIPAHPYRWRTGIGEAVIGRSVSRIRSLETWNAQETRRKNQQADTLAHKHGLGSTGGSDAHQVHDVGNGYTLLPEPVDDLDDVLQVIEKGRTRAGGTLTRRRTRLRQRLRIVARTLTLRYP